MHLPPISFLDISYFSCSSFDSMKISSESFNLAVLYSRLALKAENATNNYVINPLVRQKRSSFDLK